MRRLLFFISLLHVALCSCPAGFELVRDGQCRGKYATVNAYNNQIVNTAISNCKQIHGQPIIIHNDIDQEYWRGRANGYTQGSVPIGLVCNDTSSSKLWQWADGSKLDYKPSDGYNGALDKPCQTGCVFAIWPNGAWAQGCNQDGGSYTVNIFCTTQLQQPTGDGCDSFNDDTDDGICYQVRSSAQSWQDAQTTCRNLGSNVASIHNLEENSFIRRSAVSQGAVNGIYIGATSSGKGKPFGWIDGSKWDYDNFYPGFPVDGHGDCLAMDTFSASGEWMNMDCSAKLGVACAKKAEPRHECTAGPWKEGQVIYSPGYPYDASIPCDYFISVAAGRKVRVEVLLLEANSCCDRLVLEDDVLGGNIVANLTGEVTDQYYTTKSSNFMRVSWQPNGGVNVRGMMFSFTAV